MSSFDRFEVYVLAPPALKAGGPERIGLDRRMMEAVEEEAPVLWVFDMIVATQRPFLQPMYSHILETLIGYSEVLQLADG